MTERSKYILLLLAIYLLLMYGKYCADNAYRDLYDFNYPSEEDSR